MVSPHEAARDTAEVSLTRLIRTLAVIMPGLALLQALADSRDYRQPAAAVVVWLAVLGAGAWLVPRLRAGGLSAGETAAASAIAVAAVAAIGAAHRAHVTSGGVDLAILGTVWLLLLVVVSHSARVWVPLALLIFAVQGALVIREQGLNLLSLSQLGAAGYIIALILILFSALRPTMDMHVSMAARQASLASRAAAERAATAAIRQERDSRLAVLEREALPLLRGIADGTLDPADEEVRGQCARHAAVLRRALTDDGPGGGGLVAALGPALRAAAARGVPVTVQLIGEQGAVPPPVARAVLATVDAVLGALAPQPVTLTVLASGDEAELYLAFSQPLPSAPDVTRSWPGVPAAAGWHAALRATDTGEGFLEVSWRKDGAA
jgi:fructose-specific component phosphotransferase system IIB-like protein